MPVSRSLLRLGAVTTALSLTGAGVAFAAVTSTATGTPAATDGAFDSAAVASHGTHKHGGQAGHLPGSAKNMRLVGQQRINQDVEGRVADVAVHEGYAYLAAFNERDCQKGGVYVFDIRKPESPKQINFIRTAQNSYVGEGAQVVSLDTPAFTGDLLIHNNEICAAKNGGLSDKSIGGVSLVDVTNPKTHKVLAAGVGDAPVSGVRAHSVHSAFAWQPSPDKAYAVIVDNEESTDVDILDITDPRAPELIAEYDLNTLFPQIIDEVKGGSESFLHDMVVKQAEDGRWIMLASYWDGGYVTLDITDPMEPAYIADSDFAEADEQLLESPLQDSREPEGNAHQAEFNKNDEFILAADEDFSPFSLTGTNEDDGTPISAASGDQTEQLTAGQKIDGVTVFAGLACSTTGIPPATPGAIAVIERGVCTFTEKVATAQALGYAAALIVNRNGANACETTGGMSVEGGIPAFGIAARSLAYSLFDDPAFTYDEAECLSVPDATAALTPTLLPFAIGTVGDAVSFESYFDGWGYVRLFQNGEGKLDQLDTFAIEEAFDPTKAVGSGDLSVHEIAFSKIDPSVAYVSYYAGGTRVLRIVDDGAGGKKIEDSGHWIDADGSNVWGVEVFSADGREYVAASDRDFGLQIFEFTGPDSVNP